MNFKACDLALCVAAAFATARPASGEITLLSGEMATGHGFHWNALAPPPQYQPTTFATPTPFPNDSENFARLGPNGLEVLVNRAAREGHNGVGNITGDGWTAEKFAVVFRLDEPAPFAYHRGFGPADDVFAKVTLQAEGQSPVSLTPPPYWGDRSGVLPAGLYTFSGLMDWELHLPTGPYDRIGYGGFTDVRLTVTPEPGALPLVAVPALLLLRRRRKRLEIGSAEPIACVIA